MTDALGWCYGVVIGLAVVYGMGIVFVIAVWYQSRS